MSQTDADLRAILSATRCVAVVGASLNPLRASYFVTRYLSMRGIRVIPVNPGHAGEVLFGQKVYASLADIPPDIPVDMVDIFRRAEHVPPIVEAAIAHLPHLRVVWLQLGIFSPEAEAMTKAHGLKLVQDRCPKIEYQRLFGELRMGGFNTGVISSKL